MISIESELRTDHGAVFLFRTRHPKDLESAAASTSTCEMQIQEVERIATVGSEEEVLCFWE